MTEQKKNTITRAQALEMAMATLDGSKTPHEDYSQDELAMALDTLERMLASITKPRKSATSKTRLLNESLAHKIYDMVDNTVTSKDVAALNIGDILSSQKATAVMNVAVDLGLFTKAKDGKCLVYTKVDGDSE